MPLLAHSTQHSAGQHSRCHLPKQEKNKKWEKGKKPALKKKKAEADSRIPPPCSVLPFFSGSPHLVVKWSNGLVLAGVRL